MKTNRLVILVLIGMVSPTFAQLFSRDVNKILASKIGVVFNHIPLDSALSEFTAATGLRFIYESNHLRDLRVTLAVTDTPVEEILDRLLEQNNLTFIKEKDRLRIIAVYKYSGVRGTVTNARTGEPLEAVNVFLQGSGYGCSTDHKGGYEIRPVAGKKYNLIFQMLGYKPGRIAIDLRKTDLLVQNFRLEPNVLKIPGVTVEAPRAIKVDELSRYSIRSNQLSMTASQGQKDVFAAIQMMPGVVATSEMKSNLYIRGGNSDQNLLLLDGGIIYNPFHFSGILSAFDVDAIESVDFFAGGFPAEYGGRLSAVMDLQVRRGQDHYTGQLDLSPLSVKLLGEGPIGRRGNVLVSARKSYVSAIARTIGDRVEPDFSDGIAQLEFRPSAKERITLSGFYGQDQVRLQKTREAQDLQSENLSTALNYHRVFNHKVETLIRGTLGRFSTTFPAPLTEAAPQTNKLEDAALQASVSSTSSEHLNWKGGGQVRLLNIFYRSYDPIVTEYKIDQNILESAAFVQSEYHKNRWSMQNGIRFCIYSSGKDLSVEPRLGVQYALYNFLTLRAAYGLFSQSLVTIYNENDTYNPVDIWLPPEAGMKTAKAHHLILGCSYNTPNLIASVECYGKQYRRLTQYNRERLHVDDPFFVQGQGFSMGVDFSLQVLGDKYQLWSSYSLGKAEKSMPFKYPTPAIIDFAPRYDRRHSLNMAAQYQPISHLNLSLRFTLGSGLPFSFMNGAYERWSAWYIHKPSDYPSHPDWDQSAYLTAISSGLDAFRFPVYHRLDISMEYSKRFARFELKPYLQVLNLYDQKNVLYYDSMGQAHFSLPFLPLVGMTIKIF